MRHLIASSLLLLCHPVFAASADSSTELGLSRLQSLWEEASDSQNWQIAAGLGLSYAPEVMGSEVYTAKALPSLEIAHRSGFFVGSKGLGWSYTVNPNWQAAAFLGMSDGRKEKTKLSDKLTFKGMGDIKTAAQAGVLLNYTLSDLNVSLLTTAGLDTKNRGQQATLSADYTVYDNPHFALIINSSLTASSANYQQRWYGVSATQAKNSGFKAYQAGSGLTNGSLGLSAIVPLSKQLRMINVLGYNQLLGDAQDSPLVKAKGNGYASAILQYTW